MDERAFAAVIAADAGLVQTLTRATAVIADARRTKESCIAWTCHALVSQVPVSGIDSVGTFGNLYEDLGRARDDVFRGVLLGALFVWVDEDGTVRGTKPDDAPEVPTTWIVGTFDVGATPDDIENSLRAILHERCKDIILDKTSAG